MPAQPLSHFTPSTEALANQSGTEASNLTNPSRIFAHPIGESDLRSSFTNSPAPSRPTLDSPVPSHLLVNAPKSKLSILGPCTSSTHLSRPEFQESRLYSLSVPRNIQQRLGMSTPSPQSSPRRALFSNAMALNPSDSAQFSTSKPSSALSSPTHERTSFESRYMGTPPSSQSKVHFSDDDSGKDFSESISSSASKSSRTLAEKPVMNPSIKSFANIVAGKDSNLISKWLPTSTSSLAEPLEREEVAQELPGERTSLTDEKHTNRGILTPPFTPLRRIEEHNNNKTPLINQLRPLDKFQSRASLLTPPDTLKHEGIRRGSFGRGGVLDLNSDHSSAFASPVPQSSPHGSEFLGKQDSGVKSLSEQLKNMAAQENSRRRAVSSPTEPSFDFNRHPNLSNFFDGTAPVDPTAFHNLSFSTENDEEIAEYRKRAGTFCSTPSVPLPPPNPNGSPPRASSGNNILSQSSKVNGSRACPGTGLHSFPTISSSIFASNHPSAHAFSSPTPFSAINASRLDESTDSLSPRPQRTGGSPQRSPRPPLQLDMSGNTHDDRSPGHRHVLSGRSPLSNSRRQTASFEESNQNPESFDFGNERGSDERSMSLADPSHVDMIQSRFINPNFRPRSITVGESGTRRLFNKTHLNVNWDASELDRAREEESHKADSASGMTGSSARSSLVGLDSLPISQISFASELSAPSHPFDSNSLNRSSTMNSKPSNTLTRYCKVLGLSPKLLGSMKGIVRVRNAFSAYGELLDIYVDTLSPLGFILLGFHDIRSVGSIIESGVKALEASFGSYLKFETIQRHEVVQLTCDLKNPILSSNEGILRLHFDDPRGIITQDILTEYLQRYGELKALRPSGSNQWLVEWYDDRRATSAQKQLVTRDFADFQVVVDVPERALNSAFETLPAGTAAAAAQRRSIHERLPVSPFGPNVCLLPPTVRPPPSMLNPADQYNNGLLYRYMGDPYAANYLLPWSHGLSGPPASALYHQHASPPILPDNLNFPPSVPTPHSRPLSANQHADIHQHQHQHQQMVSMVNRPRAFPFPGVPPSNVIDLDRIECGSDPRTTCMIKNIPNKITDEMLFKFVHDVCPRGFDFLYLRMDFKARLNVGYAFINFLSVENVLRFAKAKLGVKWGVFLSEKTVQMCYASIQGKENLIEKFRNSAIMEEEESFRPKVYHSSGPQVGLPEPFPHANDLQRKARSQANAALSARQSMAPGATVHH